MEKIASFTVNHLDLYPGIYVSRKDNVNGNVITTFDLRMTKPNDEPVMNTAEIHTIEHIGATFLRNHKEYASKTIYFGPMGCRTGFYLVVRNIANDDAINLVLNSMKFIENFKGEIPGATEIECGNYKEHNLQKANSYAEYMRKILENYTADMLKY